MLGLPSSGGLLAASQASASGVVVVDALPNYVPPTMLIELLCEACVEPPPFVGRRKASMSITEVQAFGAPSLLALVGETMTSKVGLSQQQHELLKDDK